jgi:hypothetical protein
MAELLELCTKCPLGAPEDREKFEEQLGKIKDPGIFADIVAHTFLREPQHRQEVLDILEVPERLRVVTRFIQAEMN